MYVRSATAVLKIDFLTIGSAIVTTNFLPYCAFERRGLKYTAVFNDLWLLRTMYVKVKKFWDMIHVFPHGLEDRLHFPVRLGFFSILHHVRSNTRPAHFPCQREPWTMRPDCKALHSPCSAEVKNASTSTSTRPLRLHGAAHLHFYLHFPLDTSVQTLVTASTRI